MLRPGRHALFRPSRGDGLEPRPALSGAEGHPAQRHRPRPGRGQRTHAGAGARTRGGRLDYVASPLLRARGDDGDHARASSACRPRAIAPTTGCARSTTGTGRASCGTELPAKDPQGFAAREADKWGWRPTGGESYRELSERVAGWLGEVERDVVVAAHGGVMRVLRGLSLGLEPAEIFQLDVPQDKVLVVEAGRTAGYERRAMRRAHPTACVYASSLASSRSSWCTCRPRTCPAGVPDFLADLAAHLALLGCGRLGERPGRQARPDRLQRSSNALLPPRFLPLPPACHPS